MAKNNKFINQMKMLAALNRAEAITKAADLITPELYAAVALALHNVYGFGYERISAVFMESQRIWTEFEGKPEDMIRLCKEQTGISVKGGAGNE